MVHSGHLERLELESDVVLREGEDGCVRLDDIPRVRAQYRGPEQPEHSELQRVPHGPEAARHQPALRVRAWHHA